jgi:putative membrane protein
MKICSILGFLAVLAFAGSVHGQALSAPDKAFVEKAAKANLEEVEVGKLASQKASDPQVKGFADQMVTDHSKANDNLKPIADGGGVAWPARLTGESKALYDRLSKLSGSAFDKAFVRAMVEGHQKVANEYKMESTKAKDSKLKSYVQQTLPTIQQHLSHAQQLQHPSKSASAQKSS